MGEKIIGVLGGLGPDATIELYRQIVHRTRARKEQEHLRILIDNNPKVPDRIAAVFGTGPSCLPELVRSARALERAGADFIVIPCVTVHYFYTRLQKRTALPILHIIDETVRRVRTQYPAARRIGLLATTAAIRSGLFQQSFGGLSGVREPPRAAASRALGASAARNASAGPATRARQPALELLVPDDRSQRRFVVAAVREVKAHGATDNARRLIRSAAAGLIARGAQVIVAGCTEVPLVLQDGDVQVPVVDPIAILAEVAIERAGGKTKVRRSGSPKVRGSVRRS